MAQSFDELWAAFLEGDLDEAGRAELDRLLKADPELVRRAADLYDLHRLLGFVLQPFDAEAFSADCVRQIEEERRRFAGSITSSLRSPKRTDDSRRRRKGWIGYAAVAVATLVCSLALQWSFPTGSHQSPEGGRSPEAAKPRPVAPAATLWNAENAVWATNLQTAGNDRLLPQTLRLSGGAAVVRFDSGASAILDGACEAEIVSPSELRLIQGQVTVHAPEEAYGFRVTTPTSEIIDLGTEFHVAVADDGKTALHVLDGEVQAQGRSATGPPQLLGLGSSIVFDARGGRREGVDRANHKGFRERLSELRRPRAGSPLLANEFFDYTPGPRRSVELEGGLGWQGPWRPRRGSEIRHFTEDKGSAVQIESGTNVFADFGAGDGKRDGVARFEPGQSVRLRQLRHPVDLSIDANYYLSFLTMRDAREGPSLENASQQPTALRFTLRSSNDYWGQSVSLTFPSKRRPILQIGTMDRYSSPARFMRQIPLLWVVKISSGADKNDRVDVRVYESDETISPIEPTLWTFGSEEFAGAAALDLVLVTANGPMTQWFDELRIGRTWHSVVSPYSNVGVESKKN